MPLVRVCFVACILLVSAIVLAAIPATFRSEARVASPEPAIYGELPHETQVLAPKQLDCYYSLPVTAGTRELPPGFAYVGGDKRHYLIPLPGDPERFLQEGDILVYSRNERVPSDPLRDRMEKGRWHSAIVERDASGRLKHYDSPQPVSGYSFTDRGTFHVVRLREYLPWVRNAEDLKSLEADPDRAPQLAAWREKRAKILASVKETIAKLDHYGYGYDMKRYTQVTLPSELERLRTAIAHGETKSENFYCSSIIAAAYVLAGLPAPGTEAILRSVDLGKAWLQARLAAKAPGTERKTMNDLARRLIGASSSQVGSLIELGVSTEQINHFLETGEYPPWLKQDLDHMALLFGTPKFLQRISFTTFANLPRENGRYISPADLLDTVLDPAGDFEYVGTWIKDGDGICPVSRGVDQTHGAPVAEYPENSRLFLASRAEHVMDATWIKLASDAAHLESGSLDGSIKRLNLENGEAELVAQNAFDRVAPLPLPSEPVTGPWKSADGKFVATLASPRALSIEALATKKTLTVTLPFALTSAGAWVTFSPSGDLLAAGTAEGQVFVEPDSGAITKLLIPTLGKPLFSPDGAWLVPAVADTHLFFFATKPVTRDAVIAAINEFRSLPAGATPEQVASARATLWIFLQHAKEAGWLDRKAAIDAADGGVPERQVPLRETVDRVFPSWE